MAGLRKEEFPPLLPPGFHPFDLEGLRQLCVIKFPHSTTRPSVMRGLEAVAGLLTESRIKGSLWVDGSFTTEKLNPDDADIIFWVMEADYRTLTLAQRHFLGWFAQTSLYEEYRCDNYVQVRDHSKPEIEYMYAYWLKQFGFSRGEEMKGLAVLNFPGGPSP